ncbi:hypothetical protein FSP39_005087, partial [Pinctada imbricata]
IMTGFHMGGPSPLDIVFSFDTTGSMSSILDEVKGRLQDMIQRLQADIPGIRIGIIAHGDYCDENVFYLTKHLDFTNNIKDLCDFVSSIDGTGGGDQDECYEYVMRKVRTEFSWTAPPVDNTFGIDDVTRILVLIGDAGPHEPDYELNTQNIDWRDEFDEFYKKNIKIYGVQALADEEATKFYRTISEGTGGKYLKLDNFSNICDFLMAICYREGRGEYLSNYEAEVRSRGMDLHKDLEGMFGTLRPAESSGVTSSKSTEILESDSAAEKSHLSRDDSSSSTRTLSISHITSSFSIPTPFSPVSSPSPLVKPKHRKLQKISSTSSSSLHKLSSAKTKKRTSCMGTKTKRILKPHNIKKMFDREKITNTFFTLRDCGWSNWREIFSMQEITRRKCKTWCGILPSSGPEYIRRKSMFPKISSKTGLYELAIQTKPHGRRQVVYSQVIAGEKHRTMREHNWSMLLFGSGIKGRRYERQVQKVLHRGL